LDIYTNIFEEFRPEVDSISSRYHHVPLDFSSKEGRNLILKEIDRILKNNTLREEQVCLYP